MQNIFAVAERFKLLIITLPNKKQISLECAYDFMGFFSRDKGIICYVFILAAFLHPLAVVLMPCAAFSVCPVYHVVSFDSNK
jgi:hypothetical protein